MYLQELDNTPLVRYLRVKSLSNYRDGMYIKNNELHLTMDEWSSIEVYHKPLKFCSMFLTSPMMLYVNWNRMKPAKIAKNDKDSN